MTYSYSSLLCPVRQFYLANPTGPSVFGLHFDQVSSRFLAAMGFHFANFLPILLLPIDDLVDAVMTEKELSTEDP